MTNLFKLSLFLGIIVIVISSCKKEEGCTDPIAMNYSSSARIENGSCLIAYDVAQGLWGIETNCGTLPIPGINDIPIDDLLPDSINIQDENGGLFIYMNIVEIEMKIPIEIENNGEIIFDEQSVNLGFFSFEISGMGKIESKKSGYMDLNFSVSIAPIPISCHITLTK